MFIRSLALYSDNHFYHHSEAYRSASTRVADWTYHHVQLKLPAWLVTTLDKIAHLLDSMILEEIGLAVTVASALALGISWEILSPILFPTIAILFIYKLSSMAYPYDYLIDLQDQYFRNTLPPVKTDEAALARLVPLLENNLRPILIAPSGAGKTSSIISLVHLLESPQCPATLKGKKIYQLNLDKLKSDPTMMVTNLLNCISLLQYKRNAIVFIDETHRLAETTHGFRISDALKLYLNSMITNRALIQMIGATTLAEFEELRSKDEAFVRRLTPVELQPIETTQCKTIIQTNFPQLSDDTITEAITQSATIYPTLGLPARALKLISTVQSYYPAPITPQNIQAAIADRRVVPMPLLTSFKENVLMRLGQIQNLLQH